VVDVTNYVMLELGQPLHAFDDARLSGAIHVRHPAAGESLQLLNEQRVTPSADTALIADDARALALAGIMGGADSGVTAMTKDVFLESAYFSPVAIAGRARALGFSTDASHRYERGVDFELQRHAIERATQLIIEMCGGRPGPVVEAIASSSLPVRAPVRLRTTKAARTLGIELPSAAIAQHLVRLGFAFTQTGDEFSVARPAIVSTSRSKRT
jgi:phenylalanyl-tRNA synthetase beta chain